MTIEYLKKRIDRCEESLRKEQERIHTVLNRQGWGYGMTHTKVGCSFRREEQLKDRLSKLKQQLKESEML